MPIVPPMMMADRMYHRLPPIIDVLRMGAQHTADATDNAPEHAANRGADNAADRTGNAASFVKAVVGPFRDALRLRRERHGERRETSRSKKQFDLHWLFRFAFMVKGLSDQLNHDVICGHTVAKAPCL